MEYFPFSLSGKTILVTGASSGIGRAVAQECAAAGAVCFITARNQERLQLTLDELQGEGHQMFISDLADITALETMIENLPKLDGVVSCAGVVETKLLKFTEEEDLQNLFQTNTLRLPQTASSRTWLPRPRSDRRSRS